MTSSPKLCGPFRITPLFRKDGDQPVVYPGSTQAGCQAYAISVNVLLFVLTAS